jgi:hypothetical protein
MSKLLYRKRIREIAFGIEILIYNPFEIIRSDIDGSLWWVMFKY